MANVSRLHHVNIWPGPGRNDVIHAKACAGRRTTGTNRQVAPRRSAALAISAWGPGYYGNVPRGGVAIAAFLRDEFSRFRSEGWPANEGIGLVVLAGAMGALAACGVGAALGARWTLFPAEYRDWHR